MNSELECPGLEESDAEPDVVVRFGVVPDSLPGSQFESLSAEVLPGQCLMKIRGTGKFLVRQGREVVIDPEPGSSPETLRLFLLGPVLGVLLHQNSFFPLHGSAILNDGKAVVFAGPSGSGKSTLAAAFLQRNYKVIADEICAIDLTSVPELRRAPPYLLLWEDGIRNLGPFSENPQLAREGLRKFAVRFEPSAADRFPIQSCYVLDTEHSKTFALEPVEGLRKIELLAQQTYRRTLLEPLGLVEANFRQVCKVAAGIRVVRVRRPRGEFNAARVADLIAEDLGA